MDSIEPATGRIGRRRFLQIAGATIGLMKTVLHAEEKSIESEPWSVTTHLQDIPANIPGIGNRRSLFVPNAVHGLIVIEQAHWAHDIDQKTAQGIELCQRQIYNALRFLVCGQWISDVYAEGIMARGEPPPDPRYSDFSIPDKDAFSGIDEIAKIGAIFKLKEEGLLVVMGGERTKEFDRSGRLWMEQGDTPQALKAVYDDRENALLSIVHSAQKDIACAVFGAHHEFHNNVQAWNDRNPEAQFSILTLVPEIFATNHREGLPLVTLPEDRPMPATVTQNTSAPPVPTPPAPPPPPECAP